MIKKTNKVHKIKLKESKIYTQFANIEFDDVEKILKCCIVRGLIPEPIRVAHLIATGIVCGESHGRA